MATTAVSPKESARPATRRVVSKHHILVRISHWLNIPILLGLGLSGLSIYWAAPVYKHAPQAGNPNDPLAGNVDYFADFGAWVVRHVAGQHHYDSPGDWFYNHFSLGTADLAPALNLHWFFAYVFMANGLLYLIGLALGGGWRSLLPRPSDIPGALAMIRYYLGLPFAKIARKPWPHPAVEGKYNALQRGAYFSMPIAGTLAVLTGWAIHKPQQLGWLQGLFGGYDLARAWHFWIMWFFAAFVIPHVFLVITDGWDTFRSMVVGWSDRIGEHGGK